MKYQSNIYSSGLVVWLGITLSGFCDVREVHKDRLLFDAVTGDPSSAAATPSTESFPQPVDSKPNIIIFIADDLSWHDVACFGGPTDAKTPHLDQLASEGVKFTKFYSPAAVCSPARQSLLTGMFPVRTGAYPNHTFVKLGTHSLPYYLKPLGYRTMGAGKQHFAPPESYPFDQWSSMIGEDGPGGGEDTGDGDLNFKELEQFFSADKAHPFCAYVATHQPHAPWTKGDQSSFKSKILKNIPPYLVDTLETRQNLAKYYAEVSQCDSEVGTVMEILKKSGQDKNTIFIFLSEQGSSLPHSKWTLYDPGIRVAVIVRWPEKIKKGISNGALIQYVDILPTLIAAAGGDPMSADTGCPDAAGARGFDGRSFLDVLLGKSDKFRDTIFAQQTTRGIRNGSDAYAIRAACDGRWKLIVNFESEAKFKNAISEGEVIQSWQKKGKEGNAFAAEQASRYIIRPALELYDLQSDPWELTNVADNKDNTATITRLRCDLDAWMKQQGDEGAKTEKEAFDHQPKSRQSKQSVEAPAGKVES